ncbi:MAG TPA: molecular chaperone DnaJ [Chromatiales bacterium]|nr:molecular chaperone DnaJ [Chromatiales bacterium]
MGRLLLLLAVAILAYAAWRWLQKRSGLERWQAFAVAGAVVLMALAATGRLNWVFALIGLALPFLRKLLVLLPYVPVLRQVFGRAAAEQRQENPHQEGAGSGPEDPSGRPGLSVREAWDILGLEPGAAPEEIVAAHRRLIQKLHPDRGGSAYLATRINQAKDLLLKECRE